CARRRSRRRARGRGARPARAPPVAGLLRGRHRVLPEAAARLQGEVAMKAIRIHEPGGPEALVLDELPTPAPKASELLVRVEAAGLTFIAVYHRPGHYKTPLPLGLGLEGAGVVEAVGEGCIGVAVGDRVSWCDVFGSYATHTIVPAARAVPIP